MAENALKTRVEAVKMVEQLICEGETIVGLKSNTHAVLVTRSHPLVIEEIPPRIKCVDEYIGAAFCGLKDDAEELQRHMEEYCVAKRRDFATAQEFIAPGQTLVPLYSMWNNLRAEVRSHSNGKGNGPYATGIIIAGYDVQGAQIIEICPDGDTYISHGTAKGKGAESAMQYIQDHLNELPACNLVKLGRHAMRALRQSLQDEDVFACQHVTLATVGVGEPFTIREGDIALNFVRNKDAVDDMEEDERVNELVDGNVDDQAIKEENL